MQNSRSKRGAFTLVELLVVMLIIAILVALLLPAIQAVRDAARLTHCRNNMHQLGVALHAFHHDNKRFPVGTGAGAGRNWLMTLFPYIEESTFYESIDWDQVRKTAGGLSAYDNSTGQIKYDWITSKTVASLLCPADKNNEKKFLTNRNPNYFAAPIYQTFARNNYGANACLMPPFVYAGQWGLSGSDAMPCGNRLMASWATDSPYSFMSRGVMGPGASVPMRRITDGLANTVAVWEIRSGVTALDFRGTWADSRPAASILYFHLNGPNNCEAPDDNQSECGTILNSIAPFNGPLAQKVLAQECMRVQSSSSGSVNGQAKSRHVGGVNALFCDGSVRFVSDFIERGTVGGWYSDFQNLAPGWAEYRLRAWERINASADGLVLEERDLDAP